jgi:large subunit ribosomal protein L3
MKLQQRYNDLGQTRTRQRASPRAAILRKIASDTLPLRTGALAVKKGMTAVYALDTGKRTPCTVLQLEQVQVMGHKTERKHGYYAVQVGYGWRHPRNITRPMLGWYANQNVPPKKRIAEFRVRDEKGLLEVGREIKASWFEEGQFVDTRSNTHGQGFAGVSSRFPCLCEEAAEMLT